MLLKQGKASVRKKPHLALKTGEKSTRNLRLNSLIFIVEK